MSFVSNINLLSRKFSVKETDRSHRTSIMDYNENMGIRTKFIEKSKIDLNQMPEEEDDGNHLIGDNIRRIGKKIKIRRKGHWNRYEDEKLKEAVLENDKCNWRLIASKIEGRTDMSCRFRWFNYLDASIKKEEFSEVEEDRLIQAQKFHGKKWALIARQFTGRTANALKNRWHKLMAKRRREKNSYYRQRGRGTSRTRQVFQSINPSLNQSKHPQIQIGAPRAIANVGPNNGGEEQMTMSEWAGGNSMELRDHASNNIPFFDFLGIGH